MKTTPYPEQLTAKRRNADPDSRRGRSPFSVRNSMSMSVSLHGREQIDTPKHN